MQKFKEPKPNPLVLMACRIIFPFWLRLKEQLSISVRGTQQDLDAFSNHRRAVILLNHPDRQDPFVVFELAMQMHEEFYCIAARECFDWDRGWRGWLFQSLGCYSVARGKTDFHSIATTRKILLEGRRKLVVFPEAEITADEFRLHDLQKAIFHIVLDVQKELSQGDSTDYTNFVVIIPGAIKFSLEGDLDSAVQPALQDIEERLALNSSTENPNVFSRLNVIVDAYLCRVFDSYGFEKPQVSSEKLAELAAVEILRKIASSIDIGFEDTLSPTERLYVIRNKVGDTERDSVAVNPRTFHCAGIAKPCIRSDFERVERLLIMQRMLVHPFSPIQCCRILDFIECELSGAITPKGWQSCVVSLGTPIEVTSFVELYDESKEKGVNALVEHFSQKLQQML